MSSRQRSIASAINTLVALGPDKSAAWELERTNLCPVVWGPRCYFWAKMYCHRCDVLSELGGECRCCTSD